MPKLLKDMNLEYRRKKKINEFVITLKGDHFKRQGWSIPSNIFFRGPGYVSFREGISEYREFTLRVKGWKSEGCPRHVLISYILLQGVKAHRGKKRSAYHHACAANKRTKPIPHCPSFLGNLKVFHQSVSHKKGHIFQPQPPWAQAPDPPFCPQ